MKTGRANQRRGASILETLVVCGIWALMIGMTLTAILGILKAIGRLAGLK